MNRLTTIALIVLISVTSFAKELKKKDVKKLAASFYKEGEYKKASEFYEQLVDFYPKKTEYKYYLGICYLETPVNRDKATAIFHDVREKDKKGKLKYTNYYSGLANMYVHQFDDAIEFFNKAREEAKDEPRKNLINKFIENCENGKVLVANPIDAEINNLGGRINTKYEEYAPVISSDESVLIYTYRGDGVLGGKLNIFLEPDPKGDYYEDIYFSEKDEEWSSPKGISTVINTLGHDASIALSADGQTLFLYKNDKGGKGGNGEIYLSKLKGSNWTKPEKMSDNINSKFWEGSITLSSDNKTVYFSSDRPEGFGGKDIYKSTKNEEGEWGAAENLGDSINTPYDEDAPFIHPDGVTLYFSSQGHNSMGAYDIFQSKKKGGKWLAPKNIGYPINTTGDDIHYVVSASGAHGYFSSSRKGGFGKGDIYVVTPGSIEVEERKTVYIMLIKGVVTANDMPIGANITVYDNANMNVLSSFTSNDATGKYLINLKSGKEYKLEFVIDGFPNYVDYIDVKELSDFEEVVKNISLYNESYSSKQDTMQQDSVQEASMDKPIEESSKNNITNLADNKEEPIKQVNDTEGGQKVYNMTMSQSVAMENIILKYKDNMFTDINFTIQIGAFKNPQFFKYPDLSSIGEVNKKLGSDGITRFQVGEINNIAKAEEARRSIIDQGIRDAFIVAFYQGKQISLKDLYANDFYLGE